MHEEPMTAEAYRREHPGMVSAVERAVRRELEMFHANSNNSSNIQGSLDITDQKRKEIMENKEAFIHCLQAAFVAGDSKRYHHLIDQPVAYFTIGDREYMGRNGRNFLIEGDSCKAIAETFVREFI